jgi:hypothetical protein
MFNRVLDVKIIDSCKLLVQFENGTKKIYDVKKLIKKYKIFEALEKDENLFNSVKVDIGGYGISWNDDIDISCNELWDNGIDDDNGLYAVSDNTEKYDTNNKGV